MSDKKKSILKLDLANMQLKMKQLMSISTRDQLII